MLRIAFALALFASAALAADTRFEISYPAAVKSGPLTGRVFIMISRDGEREPRLEIGRVGVPQDDALPGSQTAFYANLTIGGGPAPARAYIDELLADILEGRINPGKVFDCNVGLDRVPDGYRAMAERESIKVMVTP